MEIRSVNSGTTINAETLNFIKNNHFDINNFKHVAMKAPDGSNLVIPSPQGNMNVYLHIHKQNFHTLDKAQKMYGIMMVSVIFFGPALGAMSLFGSTDRPLFNLIASSLRGVILLVPFLLLFAHITGNMPQDIRQNNLGTNGPFTSEFFF